MVSNPVFKTVPLDQIDEREDRYKITTGGPPGPLVASIRHAGILTPPVLIPASEDSFIIISGFRRIAILKQLGLNETIAGVLDGQTDHRRCIEIAVMENTTQRQLNAVEQGRVVLLLDSVYSDAGSLCRAADGLGVTINAGMAKKLRIAARMKPDLQKALIKGDVALPVALQLADMEDQSTAEQLADLIGAMGLGLNRQRELLEWIKAISRKEQISVHALLEEEKIQGLLQDPDMERKHKSRLLRQYFRKRRYPELVEAETRFHETVKSLHLGEGIRLEPSQHFEGQNYCLTIQFSTLEQLKSRYQHLNKAIGSKAMASLWEFLKKS